MLIKSTVRGYLGDIISNLFEMAVFLAIAMFLNSYVSGQLNSAGVDSIWELSRVTDISFFALVAYVIKWLSYLFIAGGLYEIAHNILYDSKETNQLSLDGDNWSKIEGREYSFPAARKTSTATINRVTKVVVSESTVDRIFGTGTLKLKLTVFLNATETQIGWTIPAIKNPHQVAAAIRSKSRDHDGARVTTTLIPRGANQT